MLFNGQSYYFSLNIGLPLIYILILGCGAKLKNPLEFSRTTKRAIFLSADIVLIPVCFLIAILLRVGSQAAGDLGPDLYQGLGLLMVIGAVLLVYFQVPWIKLNTFEDRAILRIAYTAFFLSLTGIAVTFTTVSVAYFSIPLIFGAFFFVGSVLLRVVCLQLIQAMTDIKSDRENVVIFGAGAAGIRMSATLRRSRDTRPVAFVDDNTNLHGQLVAGLPVISKASLPEVIRENDVKTLLLAVPSASKSRRAQLIESLSVHGVELKVLPSYFDIVSGFTLESELRPVAPDALLGRDKVALDTPEIAKAYAGRVVMVTGAGGSIGSELCRQLLQCKPAGIVLFEQSEFALYSIHRELSASTTGIPVEARLGSVTNKALVERVIRDENVEIILHAAAYKHVPLVEKNELEGARNNVFGTQIVAEAAAAAGIERFILVSTDKAVRPTSIMGATKRIAEQVVQDLQTRSPKTKLSMVRFGNVLGSSGSVLPLFQKQIMAGGPLTVTHPEVTRFFMTIQESARLVLLAGAFAKGGDLFVLEMGNPQKIMNIARRMIELSGRTVYDPETETGDIAIEITGLRPGEKLYEELLIDDNSLVGTPHPKILRAEESILSQIEVASILKEMRLFVDEGDEERLRQLINTRVDGFHQHEEALGG